MGLADGTAWEKEFGVWDEERKQKKNKEKINDLAITKTDMNIIINGLFLAQMYCKNNSQNEPEKLYKETHKKMIKIYSEIFD